MKEESNKKPIKKVLFIGNDLGRTGAPLMLLKISEYFKANGYRCSFFVEKSGELENDYKEIGTIYPFIINLDKYRNKAIRYTFKILWFGCYRFMWQLFIKIKIRAAKNDIIYCNTGMSGYLLAFLQPLNVPVVMHVHEMNYILKHHCGSKFTKGITFVNKYIAVCQESKQTLIQEYGIDESKINIIPEFGFIEESTSLAAIDPLLFKIGCSGFPGWRKGTDLLFQIAVEIKKRATNSNIRFYWVGYNEENIENVNYNFDYYKAKLSDVIYFIKPTSFTHSIYSQFQLQLLLSREDPNPLVVLEMGALGIPVICFKESGRTNEIVKNGGGVEVDYLGISDMADAIINLKGNNELRATYSKNIKSDILINYNREKILPEIKTLVEKTIILLFVIAVHSIGRSA